MLNQTYVDQVAVSLAHADDTDGWRALALNELNGALLNAPRRLDDADHDGIVWSLSRGLRALAILCAVSGIDPEVVQATGLVPTGGRRVLAPS